MPDVLTYRGTVYPWHCDHMGHMNVTWYVGKFDEANWNLFARIGLTPSYLRGSNCGIAAVQQNITYKRELLAGDIVEIRSTLIELREKSIRFVHEMRNAETGEIAATCEITGVHIDRQARKATAFAQDIRHVLVLESLIIGEHDHLAEEIGQAIDRGADELSPFLALQLLQGARTARLEQTQELRHVGPSQFLALLIQAHRLMPALPPQRVDCLVGGNRVQPRPNRSPRLVLVTLEVNLQERRLESVFGHFRVAQIPPQVAI